MKCEEFLNLLFEYVEDSLPPQTRAVADEHTLECESCREAVRVEKALASLLLHKLNQSVGDLTLGTVGRRKILERLHDAEEPMPSWNELIRAWSRWLWIGGAVAVFLSTAVVVSDFSSRGTKTGPTGDHRNTTSSTVAVRSSYVEAVYTFKIEGGMVIDSLEYQTNTVDLNFLASANRGENWEN